MSTNGCQEQSLLLNSTLFLRSLRNPPLGSENVRIFPEDFFGTIHASWTDPSNSTLLNKVRSNLGSILGHITGKLVLNGGVKTCALGNNCGKIWQLLKLFKPETAILLFQA